MKLELKTSHRSIKALPETELPPFTLVTGLNGTGKTHLLTAIRDGAVVVEGIPKEQVRFFDWSSMAPQDTAPFSSHTLSEERQALFDAFIKQKKRHAEQILAAGRQFGLPLPLLEEAATLATITVEDLAAHLGDARTAAKAHAVIASVVEVSSNNIRGKFNGPQRGDLEGIAAHAGRPIIALRRQDFSNSAFPSWGGSEVFQQQFGRLFIQYMDLVKANQLRKAALSDGRLDVACLTDEQFKARYMLPPWEFVNRAMQDAELDFAINSPDEFEQAPYLPRLTKISTGAEVAFADLSSGERILMSFALCLYYAEDRRQLAVYPKLLLLDEIDAPLHPSMSRHLIWTITETLVRRHDIKVIATTHSPSTVALAPEDALYVMEVGRPGVHKTSKAQALNILTHGVPTLAISHDGRRQVFVESPRDAKLYSVLYQALKPVLQSERSLEFIATGARDKASGAEHNTGRDQVKRIVTALARSGNQSAFGLIDWDGENTTSGRIHVLAEGCRDALESVILDPLVVTALILRNPIAAKKYKTRLGVPDGTNYVNLAGQSADHLQPIVDAVQRAILVSKDLGPTEKATYEGGVHLAIATAYLCCDDHELEGSIQLAFPELLTHGTKRGQLMEYAISTVLDEHMGLLPVEIRSIFQRLLDAPAHVDLSPTIAIATVAAE